MTKIGIEASEGIANVLMLGSGEPVRAIGLLMARERGVPNEPMFISNNKEDKKIFGDHDKSIGYGSYVVSNYFANLNGASSSLYGIRIVGDGSTAAKGTLSYYDPSPVAMIDIYAGREGKKDVGTWGNDITTEWYDAGAMVLDNVLVNIKYKGEIVESFTAPTLRELVGKVNKSSGFVMMEALGGIDGNLSNGSEIPLVGGTYTAPSDSDYAPAYDAVTGAPSGLALFDNVKVNIVACSEQFTEAFAISAERYARDTRKFYVHNLPEDANLTDVDSFYNALKVSAQSYVAKYLNWCEVDDGNSGKLWIPALGYYLGAGYARVASMDNDIVWSVPAGDRTYSLGIYQFSHTELTEEMIEKYVSEYLVNVVNYIPNVGSIIWSARTSSVNPLYQSIHVRLETNWLVTSLLTRQIRFKDRLMSPKLKNDMHIDTRMFMKNIYDNGGIERTVPFETAVIIDIEIDSENRRGVIETISWIPPENTEYIKVQLNRNDGVLAIVE
jgi:hypothetical protein